MKHLFLLPAFLLLSYSVVFPQGCLPEGIYFEYQFEIDWFQNNYPGCTEIIGDVTISGEIENLNGLSVLTKIHGYLEIFGNNFLTSLTGLENVTSIGGDLSIIYNNSLTSLTGLHNVHTISGEIEIYYNNALTSLSGIDNIQANSIDILRINNNPNLYECVVQSICNFLSSPTGSVNIYNNASGCNNPFEIAFSCGFNIPCLPYGNYYFTSQEEIDNFQFNYSGCTEAQGNVYIIEGNNITNLNGLIVLTSISGDLKISSNSSLTSLTGLNNLSSVGGYLMIKYNQVLTSLTGLEYLTSIGGDFSIGFNPALVNLTGMEYPTSIEGGIRIDHNHALTSLTGLDNVTFVAGGIGIITNDSLTSLTGLENISSIGTIWITGNHALTSLSGIDNITSIGDDLYIEGNNSLTSLTGLENIISIGGRLWIESNEVMINFNGLNNMTSIGDHFWIENNNSLTSFSGIENLTSISGNLRVFSNNALTSLTGLENIDAGTIENLAIKFNYLLSSCDVQSMCDYLAAPNGIIDIHDNAPGCNSPEEVEEHCLTGVTENSVKETIYLFPNPATSYITINIKKGIPIEEAIIYNHLGQKVLETKPVNNTVDVSTLKPMIYFIEVVTKEWRGGTKLIIE